MKRLLVTLALLCAAGCKKAQLTEPAIAQTAAAPAVDNDPLGPRPEVPAPAAFVPEIAKESERAGLRFWALSRPTLPLCSLALVLPRGSKDDPRGQAGLTWFAARMLEQGTRSKDAVTLAKAFESLGASFSVDVYTDYSVLSLNVLRKNLEPAFALLSEVLLEPKLAAADFTREKARWLDELVAADKDPRAVFERAVPAVHYPKDHPYAHPRSGDTKSARQVTLAQVKRQRERVFHAEGAVLIGSGALDGALLEQLAGEHLKRWRAVPSPATVVPSFEPAHGDEIWLLDQPGAAQAVIGWITRGATASAESAPGLSRVNTVLGGSFSSRLNQDLREERGLTYGASSRLSWSRGAGVFVAQASVALDKTAEAMAALDDNIVKFAKEGPNDEETERSRLLARGELVESYESVARITARLARVAGVGLPADHDAKSAAQRDAVTRATLEQLAGSLLGGGGRRLVVGPRETLVPQLEARGYRVVLAPSGQN